VSGEIPEPQAERESGEEKEYYSLGFGQHFAKVNVLGKRENGGCVKC